jgi:hypothetical protein
MIKREMFKKIVSALLLISVFAATIFAPAAKAQAESNTWYNQSFQSWYTKVYDESNPNEIFGERYTAAQVQWIFYSLLALLIQNSGEAGQEALACLMTSELSECKDALIKAGESLTSYSKELDESSSLSRVFATRPISGVAYFLNIGEKLDIVPEASAQGFGFRQADPILNLWRVFRNLTYALMIVVIVVMAFMIMFRVKISPQTVITVQSALPKIAIALILITFSYAIAGLLIDLMYVVMGLLTTLFVTGGDSAISSFAWGDMFGALTTERSAFSLMFYYFLSFTFAFFPAFGTLAGPIGTLLGLILFPIVLIVAIVVLLISGIRILWLLFKTYAMLLLQIILAPIQILLGTLSPAGYGVWLRTFLSNLAVYPVVAFMLVLAFVFLSGSFVAQAGHFEWLDDLLTHIMPFNINVGLFGRGTWDPPLTAGAGADGILWLGASLVIIITIPKAAELIKSLIEGQGFDYGTAIGQALRPWPARLAASQGQGYFEQRIEDMRRHGGPAGKAGLFRLLSRALGAYSGGK